MRVKGLVVRSPTAALLRYMRARTCERVRVWGGEEGGVLL